MIGLLQRQEEVGVLIQLPPQINTNFIPVLPGGLEALPELEVFLRKPYYTTPFANK